jgi:hypothetical protein
MRLYLSRARASALCAALALGLFSSAVGVPTVQAQAGGAANSQPSDGAREAFRRGEAAYSAGNYEVAIREWNSAFQSDPRPRIQFNLSQAYERMGQLENAIRALETFLNSGDPDDPTYSDANARLLALRQRLTSTGVVVNGGADGGQILVDDKDWGRTPRPDKIIVAPGNHALTVRWPDGREFRTSVFVPAGQVAEVLVPTEVGAAKPAQGPTAAGGAGTDGGATKDRRVLWYSLGGGVAALGIGLLTYGIVRNAAVSDCGGNTYCNPDDEDKANRQKLAGLVTGPILMAAGAALIVVGAVTHKKDDTQARAQCGIGYASAACRFSF